MQCSTQKLAGLHDGSTAEERKQLSLESMQHCFSETETEPSPRAALTMCFHCHEASGQHLASMRIRKSGFC